MSLVGKLEELGLGEILQIVNLSRKSGILTLKSKGRTGTITFRQGQVVRASSSTYQQSLGEVLIQKGVIDTNILRKALSFQQDEGFRERLGTILVRYFGVGRDVVDEIVREQIENVVFSLFSWDDGSFDFEVSEYIDTVDSTRMDPLQFMLDQGLNPQFLAMEGARRIDERNAENYADETLGDDFEGILSPDDELSQKALQKPPCIVIVDDDPSTLRILESLLTEDGYEVLCLIHSEDALIRIDSLYRERRRIIPIIDLIMPKMDGSGVLGGLELLELLQGNFKDLKVIVISDYHHVDAEKKIHEFGCNLVMKPRKGDLESGDVVNTFRSALTLELSRLISGTELPSREWLERFNLGDELRVELGDEDIIPIDDNHHGAEQVRPRSLIQGMLEELNNPELQGGVLLLILRYASEFLNRAVIFMLQDSIISGAGQFGISGGKFGGDDKVRSIHIPVDSISMFNKPFQSKKSLTFKPDESPVNTYIFEQLGGGVPEECFLAPFVGNGRVLGFLYGDNLPERTSISDTSPLELFLSHAGIALERHGALNSPLTK